MHNMQIKSSTPVIISCIQGGVNWWNSLQLLRRGDVDIIFFFVQLERMRMWWQTVNCIGDRINSSAANT